MVGGTTKLAGGGWLWAPNNQYLEALGVKQPPEEILHLLKELAYPKSEKLKPNENDLKLMKVFAYEWPDILREILREGVMKLQPVDTREKEDTDRCRELILRKMRENKDLEKQVGISMKNIDKLASLMPSYCAEHPLDLCPTGKVLSPDGSTTSLQLEKACKVQKNCEIRMGARVVDLLFNEKENEVIGVVTVDSKGGKKKIKSKGGVIFASGGFAQNKQLLVDAYGQENVPFGSCSAKTNVGDLIAIAKKYNIPVSGMDFAWFKQTVLPYSFPKRLGVFFLNGDSYMVVDRSGRRFASDRDFYQQRGMQMLRNKERRCVFFIFDERVWKHCEGPIKGLGSAYPMMENNEDAVIRGANEEELTRGIREKLNTVCPGFTLAADFASQLKAQRLRFNEMAKNGKDLEFRRGEDTAQYCWSVPRAKDNPYPNKTMYPIDQSTLRCVILGLSVLDTKGGPSINEDGQILNEVNKPIKGLYGAGNAIRSATRYSYPASGVTLSNCVLFGWKSGKHAANRAVGTKAKL